VAPSEGATMVAMDDHGWAVMDGPELQLALSSP
jgi:hypothetical protein